METPDSDALTSQLTNLLAQFPRDRRLPSERALSEQLGVSRNALRDRLMRLESIGVIERRSGSGTYLREISARDTGRTFSLGMHTSNLAPDEMLPMRIAIEREAARLAANRTDHMNLARMAEALDEMQHGTEDKTLRDSDQRFHKALIEASASKSLVFFSEVMQEILDATVRDVQLQQRRDEMFPIHLEIYDSVRAKDPIAAMSAIDRHFTWVEEMVQEGTI